MMGSKGQSNGAMQKINKFMVALLNKDPVLGGSN